MKHVVSVSLGSSTRDHQVRVNLFGEEFWWNESVWMVILKNEGDHPAVGRKVDAMGLGGITAPLPVGGNFFLRSARPLLETARQTPLVDGTGWKKVLERQVILELDRRGLFRSGKKALLTVAFDRYSGSGLC